MCIRKRQSLEHEQFSGEAGLGYFDTDFKRSFGLISYVSEEMGQLLRVWMQRDVWQSRVLNVPKDDLKLFFWIVAIMVG